MKRLDLVGKMFIVAVACSISPGLVRASTVATISYYTIGETDKDANHLAGGVFNNEVQNQLGPNGLPVLNTTAFGCTSNCYATAGAPTDVLADGEITYWSPSLNNGGAGGTSDVVFTSTATITLPFSVPSNFFPPNGQGGSDSNGFQGAKISATLSNTVLESISFNIGADDMAFAYLDGQVVCDLGGVHASSVGTCVTGSQIQPGSHDLEVFFVDMNNSQSGLTFGVNTADVTTTAPPTNGVPEPTSIALFGVALLGLLLARSRTLSNRSTGASAAIRRHRDRAPATIPAFFAGSVPQ